MLKILCKHNNNPLEMKNNYNTKVRLLVFTFFCSVLSWGQITIPDTTPIVENFNSLGNTATATLPTNWKYSVAGAVAPTWAAAGNFTATNIQASSGNTSYRRKV